MIVSTVHDYDANALILQYASKAKNDLVTILSANKTDDAEVLYEQGAHYVIVPHVVGGKHTAMLIEQYAYDAEKYIQYRTQFFS